MDNIRFLLVISLAMISYMLWDAWKIDYGLATPEVATLEQPTIVDSGKGVINTDGALVPSVAGSVEAIPVLSVPADKIITVKTDVFTVEIDTKGGTVRRLDLVKYPKDKENTYLKRLQEMVGWDWAEPKDLSPIRLFNGDVEKLFLAQSGLIANAGSAAGPDHHATYTIQQESYQLTEGQESLSVPLTWKNSEGLTVTKVFTFLRNSYDITVQQTVSNNSTVTWTGRQYSQLLRLPYVDDKGNTFIRTYAGGVVYTEENKYQKVEYADMAEENLSVSSLGGWSAMTQHYFASAWIPPADQENHFYTKELKDFRYVIGSYSPAVAVAPHTDAVFSAHLFAGPKIQPMMESVAKGLELTVDYGWLTIIGKPIYWLLNQIHDVVGNWGFSILGVTMCIKALFFKLSQASFRSMAKMRKIQPRLKAMQEKFADDRQRFNTEMMAMYKKEKVNPMGGCLPIIVQIPVFISLYWVLIETVELRQADFILWIQDLSAQDPFFVLPVIMGITMKIQQSLNPAPIDPVQAKVMKMFPLVFTVFFLFFPAGLVFYWVCNNTLSITQQWYITKQIDAES